jgi:hypothetical protein
LATQAEHDLMIGFDQPIFLADKATVLLTGEREHRRAVGA